MCGIFCFISQTSSITLGEKLEQCKCLLNNRGPNKAVRSDYGSRVLLLGTVLWQQGSKLCAQPVENDRFSFLFNGDLFVERGNSTVADTRWMFEKLTESIETNTFHNLITQLKGPFSLILLDRMTERVYFARDSLGRNSLLMCSTDDGLIISSVIGEGFPFQTIEIPPKGIYYVNYRKSLTQQNLIPWIDDNAEEKCSIVSNDKLIKLPWFEKAVLKMNFNYHTILKDEVFPNEKVFDILMRNECVSSMCGQLIEILSKSVRERTINTPQHCKECIGTESRCPHSKVGILFSGGIDCTIIALLVDKFVDQDIPIDLINVAFQKVERPGNQKSVISWDVPDRLTGRATLKELHILRPKRKWQFVEVNVPRNELENHKHHISNLVFPLKSVLDESLGIALWFAARGEGILNEAKYNSPCRVLLVGSGADELFGGYSRHRAAFYRYLNPKEHHNKDEEIERAFSNLAVELEHDWKRLPSRNLARDDRVIGDHGVTPRAPYLQEDFVSIVRSLEAYQKCYHPIGAGIGDKLTLRVCGYSLGLKNAAFLKKRALQFGSRIADSRQNANDVSIFLNKQSNLM
ncbi:asparagine synthetase domain-containing protein CG17486 isoform X2 [Malaya genurostris]|uniref:asparagine synthetase domain-containing protein CG17486 isoform X2 n=1 Tax=Malaya genurostris TaxID=325434 RepID=UPI0026F3E637|nr:asparagine synthetase domain-containing protein CG17486 isoform X2 [Malaya genurostris]